MMITILRQLAQCLLLTESIELAAAFLIRQCTFTSDCVQAASYKRNRGHAGWEYLLIFSVNLLTNPLGNFLYALTCSHTAGSFHIAAWLLIEAGVIFTEGWIFSRFHTWFQRPWLFSLVLNLTSALVSLFL